MAGEFDKLTESDKMRSFVDTSKFREQLAESNSKIFDTELKSLQIDEAQMDIGEKGRVYASNDAERQDKLKQRQYNVEFAEFSKDARTTDAINKAGQDFVSRNKGSAFYVQQSVNNRIKEISGGLVTKGQEIDLERAVALQDATIKHEKAKIQYEDLTQKQLQDDRRIKLSIENGKIQEAVDVTSIDLPNIYSKFASSDASKVRDTSITQENRIIHGNDYINNYGHISRAVTIAKQATNQFVKTYGEDLYIAGQIEGLPTRPDGSKLNMNEFLDVIATKPEIAENVFDQLLERNSSDPDKLQKIIEMQQDLYGLSDLKSPLSELSLLEEDIKKRESSGKPTYTDEDRNKMMTIGRRFSDSADTYVSSKKLEMDRTKEDLKNKNTETNINYKEKQSELATRKLRLSQLNTEATQKAKAWQTIVKANAEKDKLGTLKEDDIKMQETAKGAWDKAMSAVQEYELTPTPPEFPAPDDAEIPDTQTLD